MLYSSTRALELLKLGSGQSNAAFREGQESAIRHVVEGKGRLLVVEKTGWGKSFVYFIAVKLLREGGAGPALLVSPLLALMRNQMAAAERMGVRANTINSENDYNWPGIERGFRRNDVDILLISPERLANEHFVTEVLAPVANRISLLVVDEAHCISDWGHDFRPHYRMLARIVQTLPANLRFLATTATANNRVMADLGEIFGPDLHTIRGDLSRNSLSLQTIRMASPAERLAWLAKTVAMLPGTGIIYALTVRDANQVASSLKSRGLNVEAYTGETGSDRERLEEALLRNQVKALVATTALGMGYDKPDLSFVIHYQTPGSVVAYYQQVGRAGRALDAAYGVLLSGQEDLDITNWFIESAFPTPDEVQEILKALEDASDGLSIPELMGKLNISKGRLEKATLILSLEALAPLVKQEGKWQLTAAPLNTALQERSKRLTALRRTEQKQMQEYVNLLYGSHMRFLIEALDGDPQSITPPSLPPLSTTVNTELVQEAIVFLKQTMLSIETRRRWPAGGLPQYGVEGVIPMKDRAEAGRALSVWGDAGWGDMVKRGKHQDAYFSDQLVAACVEMVRVWNPQPAPAWVTCVPSLRHPNLVSSFARRLAIALELPFQASLRKTGTRPEQKTMANSTQQARNLDGSLECTSGVLPSSPVLLVDDMVDSRWTMTVAAWLLRKHGSGQVYPLTLAQIGYE